MPVSSEGKVEGDHWTGAPVCQVLRKELRLEASEELGGEEKKEKLILGSGGKGDSLDKYKLKTYLEAGYAS